MASAGAEKEFPDGAGAQRAETLCHGCGTSESSGAGSELKGLPGFEEEGWAIQGHVGARGLGLSVAALEEQHPFGNPCLNGGR